MDPGIIVLLLLLIGVVVVLALVADRRAARRDRARQEQQLAQMEQVKDMTSQRIRELNWAYQVQVAKAARDRQRRRLQ